MEDLRFPVCLGASQHQNEIMRSGILTIIVVVGFGLVHAVAQQVAPPPQIVTQQLPGAVIDRTYGFHIEITGGAPPLTMKLARGSLPPGIHLDPSGWLTGVPTQLGSYPFQFELRDNAAHTVRREFTLKVIRPLTVEWRQPPQVRDGGIWGSLAVANTSDTTADITVIIVAVNAYGKAFVLGYNREPMPAGADAQVAQFGTTLPAGSYSVRADVVGEVAAEDKIWRAALAAEAPLTVPAVP